MSESDTTSVTDATPAEATGNANTNAATSNALPAPVVSVSAPPPPATEGEVVHPNADDTNQPAPPTGSRKRVFTFQKRWLHTLPIMEKVLSDNALDTASVAALKAANLLGDDGKPIDDASARDVIVCMLCDDPSANRETMKMWSRINCRRGRIENHLMSKHPEFMLLLKQKREAEGDLTVQIFLQHMREGRCNVRSEISAGLYSHLQMPTAPVIANAELHGSGQKRPLAQDVLQIQGSSHPGELAGGDPEESVDAKRKRAKLQAAGRDLPSGEDDLDRVSNRMRELVQSSLLSFVGPGAFTQWSNILTGRMVVITGGEKPCIARIATNLWLLGANVLVTFSDLSTMDTFSASYLAQFHSTENGEPPRGVMLPIFCLLQTRSQIEEWTRSISGKFARVDALINAMSAEDLKHMEELEPIAVELDDNRDAKTNGDDSTTSSRLQDICQVFSGACMQQVNRGCIVNVATLAADKAQASSVEAATKSLSEGIASPSVCINSIAVHTSESAESEAVVAQRDVELLHSMLFLLSPASSSVRGTVIHLQHAIATDQPVATQPSGTIASSSSGIEALDVDSESVGITSERVI